MSNRMPFKDLRGFLAPATPPTPPRQAGRAAPQDMVSAQGRSTTQKDAPPPARNILCAAASSKHPGPLRASASSSPSPLTRTQKTSNLTLVLPAANKAKAQAAPAPTSRRTVIAAHLIHTLYGHWAVNDPRGSGSRDFLAPKFASLGPIHHGRKAQHLQPTPAQLRAFHEEHANLLNFPLIWIDEEIREEFACAITETIRNRKYTCYACAIGRNHIHLVIRTHGDKAREMWERFADSIRDRLRLRLPSRSSPHHPVISARPYNVLHYTPEDVWPRIRYVEGNPARDGLPSQHWPFVTPYDNWPFHKRT